MCSMLAEPFRSIVAKRARQRSRIHRPNRAYSTCFPLRDAPRSPGRADHRSDGKAGRACAPRRCPAHRGRGADLLGIGPDTRPPRGGATPGRNQAENPAPIPTRPRRPVPDAARGAQPMPVAGRAPANGAVRANASYTRPVAAPSPPRRLRRRRPLSRRQCPAVGYGLPSWLPRCSGPRPSWHSWLSPLLRFWVSIPRTIPSSLPIFFRHGRCWGPGRL